VLGGKAAPYYLNRLFHRFGGAVEAGEMPGDRDDMLVGHGSSGDGGVEHALGRQPLHFDQPLDRGALPLHSEVSGRIAGERYDVEIDAGRQAPVQPQFLAAGELAGGKRGEVEKFVTHRLLHFEGELPGQKHIGHVGLDDLDVRRRVRVGRRRREQSDLFSDLSRLGLHGSRSSQFHHC
jgi:hypothetical protein